MPKHKGNELKMLIVQQVLKGQTIYSLAQIHCIFSMEQLGMVDEKNDLLRR